MSTCLTRSFLAAILALLLGWSAAAAQDDPQLTDAERQRNIAEANAFADRFIDRMNQTLDVAALWDEFFIPDYTHNGKNEGYALCTDDNPQLSPEEIRRTDENLLHRKLAGEATYMYLIALHLALGSPLRLGEDKIENPTPLEKELIQFDKKWRWFGDGYHGDPPRTIRDGVQGYEEFAAILRKHLPRGWRDSAEFRAVEARREADGKLTRCYEYDGQEGCEVVRGFFRLGITRYHGQLRIAYINHRVD